MLVAGWCHPSIPTGRSDRGGGDTVGGDMVGVWRLQASVPRRVIIGEKGGFQATPPVLAGGDPTHGVSVHEAWGCGSTRHR